LNEYKKNPYAKERKESIFDKIIDPKDKDRSLKIFGIYFVGFILIMTLISVIFGNGGLSGSFGDIVNTYKDY